MLKINMCISLLFIISFIFATRLQLKIKNNKNKKHLHLKKKLKLILFSMIKKYILIPIIPLFNKEIRY